MSWAEYMYPLEGETEEQHCDRLFCEFIYARGGNHPSDVARWLSENSVEVLQGWYQEMWGTLPEEDEYVELGEDDLDVDVFVEDAVGDLLDVEVLDVEVLDDTPPEVIL